jgi:hypothetical protein
MVREFPIIECLRCHYTQRRYAKRKLTPSRQCVQCHLYFKIEDEDYRWVELAGFKYKAMQKSVSKELSRKPESRTSSIKLTKLDIDLLNG